MNKVSPDKPSFVNRVTVFKVCLGLVLALVCTLAGGAGTYLLRPPKYISNITLDVSYDSGFSSSVPLPADDPPFVEAQLTVLQTTEILYPVIERLVLTKAYAASGKEISREDAYTRLLKSMKLQNLHKPPGLIEIGICDTNPHRAASIANTIAAVYLEKRTADERAPILQSLLNWRPQLKSNPKSTR